MRDPLPRTLDLILRGMEDGLHLGAALYVSLNGETVTHNVLGEAEPGRLLQHSSSCPWLSAGKPQTAAAIAWLWERKLLKLDDLVAKYIPAFGTFGKEDITIRHCLTHTAGIRAAISAWTRQTEPEIHQTLVNAKLEPHWTVGKTAGYHVASTWYLLGEIVSIVSTKPVATFLKDHLWKPLGMNGTSLTFTDEEWDAIADNRLVMHDTSKSYVVRSPESEGPLSAGTAADSVPILSPPVPLSWETPETWKVPRPGSGVRGPIEDLARFYEYMLGYHTPTTNNPLSHTTRAAISARHRVGLLDQSFKAKVDWGLGFVCDSSHYNQPLVPYQFGPHASPRTFGHGGNQSSVGMADPEHNLVVALLYNGMPGDPRHDKRSKETLAAIYEDLGLV